FLNSATARSFMQTLLVAEKIKKLLIENKTISTRQMFYLNRHEIPGLKESAVDNQKETDSVIEDLEVVLDALREKLNLIPTPNGVLAGDIQVEDTTTGDVLDYSKMGAAGGAIPAKVEPDVFKFKRVKAKYVLVVEKFATWNLLNEYRFWKENNCILMTGKGQAARAERRLLSRFATELKLPIYIFTDLDAAGYYIYSVYKYGSMNLAFFSEKSAVPTAKFIGFMTKDIKEFGIGRNYWERQSEWDIKRAKELKTYPWFQSKEWQKEIDNLIKFKYKIEQDALVGKGLEFMAKEYLPKKIKNKDFIE
ncbi:MAG TPA: DNA topoisomerase IV subunit A, partial [Candidatus Aenigmarchaeota archaeon]|nr:DNA topoisomerase IV subunit A [Candidatus Aenigmarchaeota archaeon]HEX32896.1 DNA topoisomerase IV subunit A [Candidatus Aenigmarchaeota archaeon]